MFLQHVSNMFLQQVDTEEDYSVSGSSGADQNDTRPEKAGSVHSLDTRERETLSPVMIGLKKHRRNLSNLTTGMSISPLLIISLLSSSKSDVTFLI